MIRHDIIATIGASFLVSNIENDEFSYPKAFRKANIPFVGIRGKNNKTFEKIDIRFIDKSRKVAVLVETKPNFDRVTNPEEQLAAYVNYEKQLTGYRVIGILANTEDERIRVWRDSIDDNGLLNEHYQLQSFEDYANIIAPLRINNKE